MTRTLDRFEREARRRWLENAAHQHFGRCEGCGRDHDEEGRPLYVARQRFSRRFLCLECFEFGPDERAREQGTATGLTAVAVPERTS